MDIYIFGSSLIVKYFRIKSQNVMCLDRAQIKKKQAKGIQFYYLFDKETFTPISLSYNWMKMVSADKKLTPLKYI